MRSVTDLVDEAAVGVLGYVSLRGAPLSVAITPYVVGGTIVVSSTAAFVDKALALRTDRRVALLVDGASITGTAEVTFDSSGEWFENQLRPQELRKYPPARSLLAIPGHRTFFGWYFQRFVISITAVTVDATHKSHRTSLLGFDNQGSLRLAPLGQEVLSDQKSFGIPLNTRCVNGPATVLVHEEDDDMNDLRQLRLDGTLDNDCFTAARTIGSLAAKPTSTVQQLKTLRTLGRKAKQNASHLNGWPLPPIPHNERN